MTILALRAKIFGRYSHAVCRVKLPEKGGESNQLALVKSTEPDRNRVTHTEDTISMALRRFDEFYVV